MSDREVREPDQRGYAEQNGVRVRWQSYGEGEPTILLLPAWVGIDSRMWEGTTTALARHFRVVTYDGRGSKFSDTPASPEGYSNAEENADAIAVLDAAGVDRAVVVGLSRGGRRAVELAADHPDRVLGIVPLAPGLPVIDEFADLFAHWEEPAPDEPELIDHFNKELWLRPGGFQRFAEWFLGLNMPEPHTLLSEDRGLQRITEVPAERYVDLFDAAVVDLSLRDPAANRALLDRVTCRALLLHGDADFLPLANSEAIADHLGAELTVFEGTGHVFANQWVRVIEEIGRFAESLVHRPRRRTRGRSSARRVLYMSSPIGLGHARRDLAVADELRKLRPDTEVVWLTQSPVTDLLEHHGEQVHPLSAELGSEVSVIDGICDEHRLDLLPAWQDLSPTLLHNFMVFRDLAADERFDLWVGDESWELDVLLRQNPDMKQAPFAWFTDFVGVLPMPEGGDREARLVHDQNASMVEDIDRFPRLRDRSVFVGDPDDLIDAPLGPDLPTVRDWTEGHFDFPGYITGFTPVPESDRAGLRAELGYRPDERVCIVTVGGTGAGRALLERVIGAHEEIGRLVPDLRMVVVCGPRIDPASLPDGAGIEKRAFIPDLHRHLTICDVAVIQGGLTTSMELVANRRPFLYFPLRSHFEQQFHVAHRLDRHRAGRRMDYATATPEVIAHAVAEELEREVDYLPVPTDGAARAAAALADLF